MTEAKNYDIDNIIEYLRADIHNCIYMYIDIKKYRLKNPNMKIWFNKRDDNTYNIVIMKYYTSISIYADGNDWPKEDAYEIIKENAPNSITGKSDIIENLMEHMPDYRSEYGYVFKLEKFANFGGETLVEQASDADMLEIAKLVTSDVEIGSYYEVVDYANQLLERKHSGMGRNYIIRDEGKIIGHIATYAELDGLATTGGLIVDSNHEGKMLGAVLEGYLVNQLLNEGINVYTFVTSKKRFKLLKNMGNIPVGEYGKMIKNEI